MLAHSLVFIPPKSEKSKKRKKDLGESVLLPPGQTAGKDRLNGQGNIVATLSSGEDITERRQVEEALRKAHEELSNFSRDLGKIVLERTDELREKDKQLMEAERIAALGKVANRIAHELRNPLTVVGGFARRVYEKTPEDDPKKNYLRIMMKELIVLENRVSEIIKVEHSGNELALVNEGSLALKGDLGNDANVKT